MAAACAAPPVCAWDSSAAGEPLAPTLARHVDPDEHAIASRRDLESWARQNLAPWSGVSPESVDLLRLNDTHSRKSLRLCSYPVTNWPFRGLYEMAHSVA